MIALIVTAYALGGVTVLYKLRKRLLKDLGTMNDSLMDYATLAYLALLFILVWPLMLALIGAGVLIRWMVRREQD